MTLTEIQNRIRTKRDEIAAEVRSYDAHTSVQNSWRADRQRMLDWLDGLLSPTPTEDVSTPTELVDGYVRVPTHIYCRNCGIEEADFQPLTNESTCGNFLGGDIVCKRCKIFVTVYRRKSFG